MHGTLTACMVLLLHAWYCYCMHEHSIPAYKCQNCNCGGLCVSRGQGFATRLSVFAQDGHCLQTATSSSHAADSAQTVTELMTQTAAHILTIVVSRLSLWGSSISIIMRSRMLAYLLAVVHHGLLVTVSDVARQSSVRFPAGAACRCETHLFSLDLLQLLLAADVLIQQVFQLPRHLLVLLY